MKFSKNIKIVSAIVLTVVLVWLLGMQVNLIDIFSLLKSMPTYLLVSSFALYIFGHVGRTVRVSKLIGWKKSFHELFGVVCVHNLFVNVLPARTGELSYFYLTKKRGFSLTKSGAVLIIARILDIVAISIILLIAILFAGTLSPLLHQLSYLVALLLVVCLVLLFSLVYSGKHFISGLKRLFSMIGLGKSKIVEWLIDKGEEVVDAFNVIRSKRKFLEHLGYSLFIWGVRFVLFYLITIGLGVKIGIWIGIIGIMFPMISTFLPIQGLGGFGTFEGVWTISFMSLGISKEVAILTGFGFHLTFLMFAIIMGVYGLLTLMNFNRKK